MKQYKEQEIVELCLNYKKYNRFINVISSVPKHFPTKKGFREIFTASNGHVILGIDYNYIELCTLAMICEKIREKCIS